MLSKLKKGDIDVLHDIYCEYEYRLYSYSLKHTGDANEAKDIVQNVFLRLWDKRMSLNENLSLEPQLFQIAKNILTDNYRKKLVRLKYSRECRSDSRNTGSSDPMNQILASEKYRFVRDIIDELPDRRKQIFKLSRFEGMTYEQIANHLSISRNTVQIQIYKALSYVRKRLREIQLLIALLSIFTTINRW